MSGDASKGRNGIIFAGGGTGGHIVPALAIAEAVREQAPETPIVFACSARPIDRRVLEAAGETPSVIPASPFGVRPGALLNFARCWPKAVSAADDLIVRMTEDGVRPAVVAMGGFVCAPVAAAAKKRDAELHIVNLDAVPGRAIRWLGRTGRATRWSVYDIGPGWTRVDPIVRRAFVTPMDAGEARGAFGLDPDRRTLLITGGSQGSRTVNEVAIELVRRWRDEIASWQIIHQCGERADADQIRRVYHDAGVNADVRAYLSDMPTAWRASSLAICRGGAGTIAEAAAVGVPLIVLPYPFHADAHQRENARAMVESKRAIVLEDRDDPGATLAPIADELAAILNGVSSMLRLRDPGDPHTFSNGAARIAEALRGNPAVSRQATTKS